MSLMLLSAMYKDARKGIPSSTTMATLHASKAAALAKKGILRGESKQHWPAAALASVLAGEEL
jgi:hypothetical protein